MFSQNCNLEVLSLGHGNKGVQLDPNVFLGANKIKILDLGTCFNLNISVTLINSKLDVQNHISLLLIPTILVNDGIKFGTSKKEVLKLI